MPLPEFSYVTTVQDNATPAGILTAGAEGTILTVYPATRTYMIEFYEPLRCVETVAWDNVVPVGLDDIPLPEPSVPGSVAHARTVHSDRPAQARRTGLRRRWP